MNKILLSTDIGTDIDDAFCLLAMLRAGIKLEAVYVTNGEVKMRAMIAKHLINLAQASPAVAIGSALSYDQTVKPFDYDVACNVPEGLIDAEASSLAGKVVYQTPLQLGITENGIEDMANRLRKEKCVIFSIAPLTNIACLMRDYPEVIPNIERLYVMGCRLFSEETHLEHNIKYDPQAARIVFESEIPITVVPGDVCSRYRMPSQMLEQLTSPAGKYVKNMALSYLALLTFSEIIRLKSHDYVEEALELGGWYKDIKANLSNADKDAFLRKIKYHAQAIGDDYCALYEPVEYLKVLDNIIEHIENSKGRYRLAEIVLHKLKKAVPESLSVSDAYIPFCYQHPESIKVTKGTVKFHGPFAESFLTEGDRHEIVTDIDAEHFKAWLKSFLQ